MGRVPLVVVDEVGYVPFDPEAAKLMFHLVASRFERALLIVTGNKPFSAWGEIVGDDVVATAMLDRLGTTPRSSRPMATASGSAARTSLPHAEHPRRSKHERVHFSTVEAGSLFAR